MDPDRRRARRRPLPRSAAAALTDAWTRSARLGRALEPLSRQSGGRHRLAWCRRARRGRRGPRSAPVGLVGGRPTRGTGASAGAASGIPFAALGARGARATVHGGRQAPAGGASRERRPGGRRNGRVARAGAACRRSFDRGNARGSDRRSGGRGAAADARPPVSAEARAPARDAPARGGGVKLSWKEAVGPRAHGTLGGIVVKSAVLRSILVACWLCVATAAGAKPRDSHVSEDGRAVKETRPAAADALVTIKNINGTITVSGWDRSEVEVTGTVSGDAEGVDVSGTEKRIKIEVRYPENQHNVHVEADLDIKVPVRAGVRVNVVNSPITISKVEGEVELEAVNGDIEVSGKPASVEAQSVNGTIEVTADTDRAEVETVNGR